MSANIAGLTTGIYKNPILDTLLKRDNLHISIICSNLLDYELPPKIKNAVSQWHRHELRQVLKQSASDIYSISPSLKNLLEENDRLNLSELDLAITAHISQIEQNSKNLKLAYELLLKETQIENVSLIPLTDENPNLLAFKSKKYAPVRYYFEKEELMDENPPQKEDKSKRKYDEKKLTIENFEILRNIKLSDDSNKAMQDSDLILILSSDIVSFGSLVRATELEKQIKRINTPIVLVWPFEANRKPSNVEKEIAETMNFGPTLDLLADDVANLTDYLIIKKSDKGFIETLRKAGCHVLVDDIWDENDDISDSLIKTILSIGNISDLLDVKKEASKDTKIDEKSRKIPKKIVEPDKKITISDVKLDEEREIDEIKSETASKKSISQLIESPEEAGKIRSSNIKEQELTDSSEEVTTNQKEKESVSKGPEISTPAEKKISSNNQSSVSQNKFEINEEEEWIDTVKRGIELSFIHNNDQSLDWLVEQSKIDNDNEIQIAEQVINTWIEARTNTIRRKGAEIVSLIAEDRRDTYLQILQMHMITAVTEGKEDLRRRLIPLFSLLHEEDGSLSEALIKGLTRQLSLVKDNHDIAVIERAKLTTLQLVILNKKLTKVAINELLNLLESRPNVGSEIWNILIACDAGSVALELLTNFSLNKAEEIVRRSNLLRFTGSYYSTFSKVMKAWKEGDRAEISAATGSILPEETLRKFERLELARKVMKLKMVQLSTLAESLGKDVETVERLITELIVNDELHAEMKLIDDKMYLIAEEDISNNN